ncbi:MAG: glycosyltransferase family 4 protein [Bacillota bacterium]
MKILMLNYEFPPLGGGAGNANYYILKELSRYPDLEIDLITSSAGKYRYEQFAEKIKVHYLDINKNERKLHYQTNRDLLLYTWKAYRYAQKLIKREQYELCHAFFGIPCGYLAMKLSLPYIVSLRGSDVPFYNRRFYWLDKLIFRRLSARIWKKAKRVIANSAGLKELAKAACPDQDISVIWNGVDIEDFYPGNKNRKKVSGKVKLISVGRLIERKGYRYLIEAIKNMPNVELKLIGDGKLKEELEELARKYRVQVKFMEKVKHEHIAEHLRKADIFILPSLNEGMSNAVIEAMACGLPVITTDTGGSQELIKGNGFIVRKGAISNLEDAIKKFIVNPDLIKTMGNVSRELAEKMDWKNVAASYHAIYSSIVG